MEFVSLIHSSQPNRKITYESFEDIRLTELLPEGVISVMAELPDEADLKTRQELFRYFLKHGTDEIEDLRSRLIMIKRVFDAYETAESKACKSYIFTALAFHICELYRVVECIKCNVGFFAVFSKQFAELYDPVIHGDLRALYERLVREVSLELKEDRVVLKDKCQEGFVPRISRCADAMGLTTDTPEAVRVELNYELAESILKLRPDLARDLEENHARYKNIPDRGLFDYIEQLEFYIENTALVKRYTEISIPHAYPVINTEGSVYINEAYDITLMSKDCREIIPNDISFTEEKPLFFLTGANGGGKTTYLRACGVACALGLNGCPVPCHSAALPMLDTLCTHFPRDERFDLEGRFLDEQNRVERILSSVGKRSLVLLNETYSTTNEQKAAEMTAALADRLYKMGQYGVYVTHQKKAFGLDIPMLACVIDEAEENRRTYKIAPVDASSTSHARDILKKYSLTRSQLEKRFGV